MLKNNKNGIIIHAGFPKCASTFLQKQIFPKLNSYKYIENSAYNSLAELYLNDISKEHPIFKLSFEDNILISQEGFMHYDLPLAWRKYGERMRQDIFISNIIKLFKKKGKLIFIIRRQDSIIRSWMTYEFHFQNENNFFVDYPVTKSVVNDKDRDKNNIGVYKRANLVNKYGATYTSTFDYFDILKRISNNIDKDRICVLIYEDLINNQKKFYNELGNFIGEDLSRFINAKFKKENVAREEPDIRSTRIHPGRDGFPLYRRLVPEFFRKIIRRAFSKRTKMSDKFRKEIMELYRENNQRLSKDFKLDIKKYEYY